MTTFLVALGLVFVIEGLFCAATPHAARRAALMLVETPEQALRVIGIVSAVAGVGLIWLVRQLS